MNAGEPPDETGDSEADDPSTDPDSADAESDGDAVDPQDGAAPSGNGDGELDPASEVEAAVEDVMGPGVLDDGDDADDGDRDGDDGESADGSRDGGDEGGDDWDAGGENTGLDEDAASGDVSGPDAAEPPADTDSRDDAGTEEGADTGNGAAEGHDTEADAVGGHDDGGEDVVSDDSESEDSETDDAPAPGDGESFRRDEPVPIDDDSADGGGVDESAAVQAAQELADVGRGGGATDGERGDGASSVDGDGATSAGDAAESPDEAGDATGDVTEPADESREALPPDVRKYDRFKKIDGGTYDRANEFLRDRTYITAREWAMARLCADFRTETGVEMTKIGENLPELVPFMTDTYTPQAVNQARAAFEEKVRKAGATFLYGAMCDFFTAEELDDVMYEATEVAKFLLEVEGVELSVDEELAAEDHISEVMRDVREHSAALRHDEVTCPECGHEIGADD